MLHKILILLLFICAGYTCRGQQKELYVSFDNDTVAGVKGNARLFDGYFTSKEIMPSALPKSTDFTIEAWIAIQEYATNVAAIADCESEFKQGYLFGINQYGKLSASVAVNDKWLTVVSDAVVPLLKWTHVAMTIENGKAGSLFINGKKSGNIELPGPVLFCDSCNLSIGKTQTKTTAANTERATSMNIKTYNRFDGLIDEFFLHTEAWSDDKVARQFASTNINNPQPLQYRQMPSGPSGPANFGAFYTKLKYTSGWDNLWRGSEYPDIVVRFRNSPVKFVFWRGTGYIPAIVNEKNMWMTDQSLEHYGTGECYEAMGDKQTRYSHVRIIENTPARVVVHWRYALAGIKHQLLPENEWGWSDWADEYWTIYPDGIAARKQVLWSKRYETDKGTMQWQETIFFNQPGTRPQDNVEMNAITFMDMQGAKATYSWQDGPPKKFETPTYKPIELVNFKAVYKPFSIFDDKRICNPFSFGMNREYTSIPNWNHWPVQQVPSDGRTVVAPDKPSHSSLTASSGKMQIVEKKDDGEYWASSLRGMTDGPVDSLMMLAKSWNAAAPIVNLTSGGACVYDKYARAYVVKTSKASLKNLSFKVAASAASPVYNLPLVIEGWNPDKVHIAINNKALKAGKDFTTGAVPGLEQTSTIIFINYKSVTSFSLNIIGNFANEKLVNNELDRVRIGNN